jgi:hypothetical protein
MDLHVRPMRGGNGFVAYDDNGHSAGGADENAALIAFHEKYPEVEASRVDMADEPVEMVGTPIEEARHQALLDGVIEPDHIHGDVSMCMQYINALAARVEVLEQSANTGEPVALVGSDRLATAEDELALLRHSLASDWRNFVFEPSHAEVMLIGVIPLLHALINFGPEADRLTAIAEWFNSIATERGALALIAQFLTHDVDGLPDDVAKAVKEVFAL